MNTYKITNITNQLNKRNKMYKSGVDIVYIDKRIKKTIKVIAGQTIYLTVPTLPISTNRLRLKNMITVTEVSAAELTKLNKPIAVKKPVEEKVTPKSKTTTSKTTTSKKKTTKFVETEDAK